MGIFIQIPWRIEVSRGPEVYDSLLSQELSSAISLSPAITERHKAFDGCTQSPSSVKRCVDIVQSAPTAISIDLDITQFVGIS